MKNNMINYDKKPKNISLQYIYKSKLLKKIECPNSESG